MRVSENRLPPFCWQGLADLQHIRNGCPEKSLSSTLAVYLALTEGAQRNYIEGGRDGFVETRAQLAKAAGVAPRTFDAVVTRLTKLGLVHVERRQEGTVNLPSSYQLEPLATIAPPVQTDPLSLHTSRAGETSTTRSQKKPLQVPIEKEQVLEVWNHYQEAFPKGASQRSLDAARQSVIERALRVRTAGQCAAAIRGLASSDHHVKGGFTDIRYALRGKPRDGESDEDRIDAMAARAAGWPGKFEKGRFVKKSKPGEEQF